jgi:Nuclease-related domain
MKLAAAKWMMFPESKKWAPPLAVRQLPGQSPCDQKERLTDNWLIPFFFTTALCWILWLVMNLQSRSHLPFQPKIYLCFAVVATGVTAIKFGGLWGQFRKLNRGAMIVAEQLEELHANDFRCFHDIVRDGFNIDHVVVGPPGVFTVERKFRSGSGEIEFKNGQGIFVGGREEERDSLKQARGNARAVHDLIREDAAVEVFVKPLVVFVGDWKMKNAWRDTDVRVITAGDVQTYFQNEDQSELTKSEIELISSHLKRMARDS